MTRIRFAVKDCPWSSFSPSNSLPAFDMQDGKLMHAESSSDDPVKEMKAAFQLLSILQNSESGAFNLDIGLSSVQQAEILALRTLIEAKLIPALLYSTWCEPDAFWKCTRPQFGKGLDFPLSYFLPFLARRNVYVALKPSAEHALHLQEDALQVLKALTAKLLRTTMQGNNASFLVGTRPTSLDALAFSCLAYIKASPVVYEGLRNEMKKNSALKIYVDTISENYFSSSIPDASPANLNWSTREVPTDGTSHANSSLPSSGLDLKGKLWLGGAFAAIAGYVLFSGEYFQIGFEDTELGEDEDGEEPL